MAESRLTPAPSGHEAHKLTPAEWAAFRRGRIEHFAAIYEAALTHAAALEQILREGDPKSAAAADAATLLVQVRRELHVAHQAATTLTR
jgi:hypothetical protein